MRVPRGKGAGEKQEKHDGGREQPPGTERNTKTPGVRIESLEGSHEHREGDGGQPGERIQTPEIQERAGHEPNRTGEIPDQVFNIETETGNYFAAGLLVHNSQRLKTPDGKASLWVSKLAERIEQRIALTGTPMPNSPLDVFAQFRALDKSVYGTSFHAFKDRFAEFDEIMIPVRSTRTRDGRPTAPQLRKVQKFKQMKNESELNELFYQIAFRVTAEDALDLPDTTKRYIEFNLGPKAQRIYDELHAEFQSEVQEGVITNAANALSRLLRLQQITSGFAATDQGEIQVDDAKEKALEEMLDGIGRREPAVVFARFRPDLNLIHRVAERLGRQSYEISGAAKQLTEWKEEGGVLAVQIQAGGLGLDLTEARYCIYYSMGFSLGDYQQSMARLHRPGQERKVEYVHLIAAGTVDTDIMRALDKKERVILHILERARQGKNGET